MKTEELREFIIHNPKIKTVKVNGDVVHLIYRGGQRDVLTKLEKSKDFWSFNEEESK